MIYLYCLFALTTALSSIYEHLMPVLQTRREDGYIVEDLLVVYLVYLVCVAVAAPVMFFSCIVPSMSTKFKASLYQGLFAEE